MVAFTRSLERVASDPVTLLLLCSWLVVVGVEYKYITNSPIDKLIADNTVNNTTNLIGTAATYFKKYNHFAPSLIASGIVIYNIPDVATIAAVSVVEFYATTHSLDLRFHILVSVIIFVYFALNKPQHRLVWLAISIILLYNM